VPRHSGVFVTGTDTNVGKTVVSAALLRRYRRHAPLRYWKPVQTGIEQDDDTAEVQRLADCEASEILADGVRLRHPVSPHLAAVLNDRTISLDALMAVIAAQPPTDRFVVEGAGGVLVPLNESDLMIDLIARLGFPAVVVSRSGLGTINHTLLTLLALRGRGVPVAGVVMVGEPYPENRLAIEAYGRTRVLGHLPLMNPLTPALLGRWAEDELDPDSCLLDCLT
jgi:dethiobiotin synthase